MNIAVSIHFRQYWLVRSGIRSFMKINHVLVYMQHVSKSKFIHIKREDVAKSWLRNTCNNLLRIDSVHFCYSITYQRKHTWVYTANHTQLITITKDNQAAVCCYSLKYRDLMIDLFRSGFSIYTVKKTIVAPIGMLSLVIVHVCLIF
jgi:hypothetical protein